MTAEHKACCAALYEHEWVRILLGESFHPGGLMLTERLGRLLHLDRRSVVLDVACGQGTSAAHLARTFGCRVIGVDLSAQTIARARGNLTPATGVAGARTAPEATRASGTAALVEFHIGDGENLPIPDASVDAVICECAFCTFPSKDRAAAEFARVLRPGGVVGLSDLTRVGQLPAELDSLLAWIACIADARPAPEYVAYLCDVGLSNPIMEAHDEALTEMVTTVRAKLLGAELLIKLGKMSLSGVDIDEAKSMARVAEMAVRRGQLGYTLITARKESMHLYPTAVPADRP